MTAVPSILAAEQPTREREALLLAGLLRSSRLTLLCGEAGVGKTRLLEAGVMPLLRRRADDQAPRRAAFPADPSRVVIPFPDRRRRGAAGAPEHRGELAVYFDDWRIDPLPHLRRHLRVGVGLRADGGVATAAGTLSDEIRRVSRESGLHLLILLDGFERYLEAPPLRTDIERFAHQFVQAVNEPSLPANFLLSMRSEARPLLDRFRGRLQGLDRNWMNLTAPLAPAVPLGELPLRWPPLVAVPAGGAVGAVGVGVLVEPPAAALPPQAPHAPHVPAPQPSLLPPLTPLAPADEVQQPVADRPTAADAGGALSPLRTEPVTVQGGDTPWPIRVEPTPAPLPEADTAATPATPLWSAPPPGAEVHAAAAAAEKAAPPGDFTLSRWPPRLGLTLTALALAAALALWGMSRESPAPVREVPVAAAPAALPAPPAPRPPPTPAWRVQTGPEQRTDARAARELMGHLPPTLQGPPLQIAHYDALRAARQEPGTALRIVAPLFTEEIQFLVRADSPLRYIHQIRDSAINVGPARAGRPSTGELLYERLFRKPVPATQIRTQGFPAALAALAAGTTDVVVLVDAQPSAWLAELPPEVRRAVRPLALDASAPESKRALQGFLPATLHNSFDAAGVPTLAVMSFLVAEGGAAPASAARAPSAAAAAAAQGEPALTQLAQSLCQALPALRRDGHPKWREVQPALELPVGWPYDAAVQQALRRCTPPPVPPQPTGDSR